MSSSFQDQKKPKSSGPEPNLSASERKLETGHKTPYLAKKPRWFNILKSKQPKSSVSPLGSVHEAAAVDPISAPKPFGPANSDQTTPAAAPLSSSKANKTALTTLKLVLQALSATSHSAGCPWLNLPFDSLLAVINKLETMSQNAQGFRDLVDRLSDLQSTLSRFVRKATADLTPSFVPLKRELESLRNDIQSAMSDGRVERFINSTEDNSSLAGHNRKLDSIMLQLTLDISTYTSQGVDEVLQGVAHVQERIANFQADVTRIELSRKGEPASIGMTQIFHGAKINTGAGAGNGAGGDIGCGNHGLQTQDFSNADISTGGGNVGVDNTAQGTLDALEKENATLLKLRAVKSRNPRRAAPYSGPSPK